MVALAAHGQIGPSASSNGTKAEAVVDAAGKLRGADAYRTTYEFLGSWAVAADQDAASKELHVVYALPGTITAYRRDGRFSDGVVLVKEVFAATTERQTTRRALSARPQA